jgi:hypothetical protein
MNVFAPERLAQHARDLAQAFSINLIEDPALPPHRATAEMKDVRRLVTCHPVIDETTYAVVLHELGHHLSPNGHLPSSEKRLMDGIVRFARLEIVEEEAAWAWAQHNALLWTPLMGYVMDLAMGSYHRGLEQAEQIDHMASVMGIDIMKVLDDIKWGRV